CARSSVVAHWYFDVW
nr:immunoglobulin heavy chain junction region [Mus musculus]